MEQHQQMHTWEKEKKFISFFSWSYCLNRTYSHYFLLSVHGNFLEIVRFLALFPHKIVKLFLNLSSIFWEDPNQGSTEAGDSRSDK